jgi:hypothetical protein
LPEFGEKVAQVKKLEGREGVIRAEIRFSEKCGPTSHGLEHKGEE